MLKRMLWLFSVAALAGCGGQLDTDGDDSSAILIHPPVRQATAYVEWQFHGCLTPDQRAGLAQAMQQIQAFRAPQLSPTVGASTCESDGDEHGGLFPANTSAQSQALTLSSFYIRPSQKLYTFQVTPAAINVIAAGVWASASPYIYPRFDAGGTADPNGRFQITGSQVRLTPGLGNPKVTADVLVHVLDTQTQKTADIDSPGFFEIAPANGPDPTYVWGAQNYPQASPASSTDPYVQTIINAIDAYLTTGNGYFRTQLMRFAPLYPAGMLLYFNDAPSLNGWPLPFDMLDVDAAGDLVASGGDEIG